VTDGETICDPLAATATPFKVTAVAFFVVHVNVVDWPLWIALGAAVSVAVGITTGAGAVAETLTVARDVTLPDLFFATRV
jgi:hypothetical protein